MNLPAARGLLELQGCICQLVVVGGASGRLVHVPHGKGVGGGGEAGGKRGRPGGLGGRRGKGGGGSIVCLCISCLRNLTIQWNPFQGFIQREGGVPWDFPPPPGF